MNKKYDEYFAVHTDEYANATLSKQSELYLNTSKIINDKIYGCNIVLDIGNGGVINYDYSHINRLDCGDLFVSGKAIETYASKENISFFHADVTNLVDINDNTYDVVIVQFVLHHLAAIKYYDTVENVRKAVHECMRVLKPKGKLLIIESVVVSWFERVQRLFYPLQCFLLSMIRFGLVYQFSSKSLYKIVNSLSYRVITYKPVSIGKYVFILGKFRLPTIITPFRAVLIEVVNQ